MTRRQLIQEMLEAKACTLKEISAMFGITVKHAEEEVMHVVKTSKQHFDIAHAKCVKCKFIFSKRDRLTKPSRCPKCKSERITQPAFFFV